MSTEGEKPGKLYYSMGEVAEMLDVNQSLIRFWEQKFDVIKPKKNKKGNRMFTPADVQNLKMIYHLVKERGMTLTGAQKYMKASRGNIERDMELAERLQSIRSLLLEVRHSLGADGPLIDGEFDDTPEIQTEVAVSAPAEQIPEPKDAAAETAAEEAIEEIEEQAHEEEGTDALTDDIVEELINEPEEMLDFDPTPVSEPETEEEPAVEEEPEEPQKPLYIEQTLF